jgi:hypothetical protein
MPLGWGLFFGIGFLIGGLFQFLWGDTLMRDHLAWARTWPLPLRILGGQFRMWPKRFDRAYAVITGLALMAAGIAFLVATAVETID